MDLYAENILDHYRHPRCKQHISHPTVTHEEANHSCGDVISIELEIADGTIQRVGWQGTGCAISQAGMSILCEELEGKSTDDILSLGKDDIYELLGVPIGPRRFKCALICLHTVKNAIRKNQGDEPQSWLDTVEISD